MKIGREFIIIILLSAICSSLLAQNKKFAKTSKFVYQTSISAGTSIGTIEYNNNNIALKSPLIGVQQLIGFQFNSHFYMGFVAGVDIWKRTAFIPLSANFTVNFMKKNWTPHWYANLGYAFKWYVETQPEAMTRVIQGATPGAQAETGLGVTISMNKKLSLLFSLNYKLQQSTIKYSVPEGTVDFSQYSTNRSQLALYHFVGIKFSILY